LVKKIIPGLSGRDTKRRFLMDIERPVLVTVKLVVE